MSQRVVAGVVSRNQSGGCGSGADGYRFDDTEQCHLDYHERSQSRWKLLQPPRFSGAAAIYEPSIGNPAGRADHKIEHLAACCPCPVSDRRHHLNISAGHI